MMTAQQTPVLRGELRLHESMAAHTSWRAGGAAQRWYRPADRQDLVEFLSTLAADEPLLWLGLGSNLLVRDGGLRGTVIATYSALSGLARPQAEVIRVGAGESCARVARYAARAGLVGAEFLAGIPGTLGGALAMNAGAFGGETWPLVIAVETIDRQGVLHQRTPADYRVAYRHVEGPAGEWFLSADLQLASGDAAAAQARIKALLETRSNTQPTQQPSCGSVFRNPEGDYAARLIETAGLKGQCIGAACVSEKHANFIVNTGGASATDIEAMIEHVRDEVERVHGVRLRTEVHIVGDRRQSPDLRTARDVEKS